MFDLDCFNNVVELIINLIQSVLAEDMFNVYSSFQRQENGTYFISYLFCRITLHYYGQTYHIINN